MCKEWSQRSAPGFQTVAYSCCSFPWLITVKISVHRCTNPVFHEWKSVRKQTRRHTAGSECIKRSFGPLWEKDIRPWRSWVLSKVNPSLINVTATNRAPGPGGPWENYYRSFSLLWVWIITGPVCCWPFGGICHNSVLRSIRARITRFIASLSQSLLSPWSLKTAIACFCGRFSVQMYPGRGKMKIPPCFPPSVFALFETCWADPAATTNVLSAFCLTIVPSRPKPIAR